MTFTLSSSVRSAAVVALLLASQASAPASAADAGAPAATAGAAATAFDLQAWQDDYAFLKKQMEAQYSNLAWFASPQGRFDLPRHDRYTQRALAQVETDDQARAVLRAFVDALHDGHFRLAGRAPPPPPATAIPEPPPAAVEQMDAATACAALGMGSTGRISFSLPLESLAGFKLESDGVLQAFRVGTLTSAGGVRLGIVRIPRFRASEYPALCLRAWSEIKAADGVVTAKKLKAGLDGAWFATLAGHLKRLQAQGARAVIVDLGGNGGGNDLGDWTVRMFTAAPVRSPRLMMAAGPIAEAYLDGHLKQMRAALDDPANARSSHRAMLQKAIADFEGHKAALPARACDLSWVWREQRPWQPGGCSRLADVGFGSGARDYLPPVPAADTAYVSEAYWAAVVDPYRGAWTGPVYALTDRDVGSAAEGFVAMLRDGGVGKVVGTATAGLGCGNMVAARPIVLPHSRLSIQAPDCVRLRADGTDEAAGIPADLPLAPLPGESDRARAARLIAVVEQDLQAAKGAK